MENEKNVQELHPEMIEAAKAAISGKGDGRISKADAEKILHIHKNNPGAVADKTLQKIMETHKHTPEALTMIADVANAGSSAKLIGDYRFDEHHPPQMKNLHLCDWPKYLNTVIWKDPTPHKVNGEGFINSKSTGTFDLSKGMTFHNQKKWAELPENLKGTLTSTRAWIRKGQLVSLFADTTRKHLEVFENSVSEKTTMKVLLENSVGIVGVGNITASIGASITKQNTVKERHSRTWEQTFKKDELMSHWKLVHIHELKFDSADGTLPVTSPFTHVEVKQEDTPDSVELSKIPSDINVDGSYSFNLMHPPLVRDFTGASLPRFVEGPKEIFTGDFNLAKLTNARFACGTGWRYAFCDLYSDNSVRIAKNQNISQLNKGKPVTITRQYKWKKTTLPKLVGDTDKKIKYVDMVSFSSRKRVEVDVDMSASIGLQFEMFTENAKISLGASNVFEESTTKITENSMEMTIPANTYYTNWQLEEHISIDFSDFEVPEGVYVLEEGMTPTNTDEGMETGAVGSSNGHWSLKWEDFLLGRKGYYIYDYGLFNQREIDEQVQALKDAFARKAHYLKLDYAHNNESFSVVTLYADSCDKETQAKTVHYMEGPKGYRTLPSNHNVSNYKPSSGLETKVTFKNNSDKDTQIYYATGDTSYPWDAWIEDWDKGESSGVKSFPPNQLFQIRYEETGKVYKNFQLIEIPSVNSRSVTITIKD